VPAARRDRPKRVTPHTSDVRMRPQGHLRARAARLAQALHFSCAAERHPSDTPGKPKKAARTQEAQETEEPEQRPRRISWYIEKRTRSPRPRNAGPLLFGLGHRTSCHGSEHGRQKARLLPSSQNSPTKASANFAGASMHRTKRDQFLSRVRLPASCIRPSGSYRSRTTCHRVAGFVSTERTRDNKRPQRRDTKTRQPGGCLVSWTHRLPGGGVHRAGNPDLVRPERGWLTELGPDGLLTRTWNRRSSGTSCSRPS
jgi:hypothetical protein